MNLPHKVVDCSVPKDAECKVHGYEGILEVAVHNEIGVRQPDVLVVVYGIKVVILALI